MPLTLAGLEPAIPRFTVISLNYCATRTVYHILYKKIHIIHIQILRGHRLESMAITFRGPWFDSTLQL